MGMLETWLLSDCIFYKGDRPCIPHKNHSVKCFDSSGKRCDYYSKTSGHILIIKLGAIGDIIRTTPLFTKLQSEYPAAKFYWLTLTPEILPKGVHEKLNAKDPLVFAYLHAIKFNIVINLDKDKEACGLTYSLNSTLKYGFTLKDGVPWYCDKLAESKYLTGVYDDLNKVNTKSYPEEIFEIMGFHYEKQPYVLDTFDSLGYTWNLTKSRRIVGLNTGCGGRWVSRLWPDKHWLTLIKLLTRAGYEVVLLGGKDEDIKNKFLASRTEARYLGHFELPKFINLVNQCDLVVTVVTMALHIGLGLKKKVVLLNNIFNKHEFEMFGLGTILEPEVQCECFFKNTCSRTQGHCMEYLHPKNVLSAVQKLLPS